MDADHCLFTVGLQADDMVSCAIEAADVVITLGYDMVEYHPRLWNPNDDKHVVHLDFLPAGRKSRCTTCLSSFGFHSRGWYSTMS